MNSKGLSEKASIIINFILAFLVVLVLVTVATGSTRNATRAVNTDPSSGFDIPKEDFCNKACAKDTTGQCGGPTVFYDDPITCRQHLDSIQKTLEVKPSPNELKTGANILTITVGDSKTKAPLSGAKVATTYAPPGTYITDAAGITTITYVLADIPKKTGVGSIEGTVKLTGYPDATFNVLVRE